MREVEMLRPLDPRLRSRLRSGVAIASPSVLIEELVENALDARAQRVDVHADLTKMDFVILDDGQGVAKEDLELIGQRYMSSKCSSVGALNSNNFSTYGYRGEALASIVNVSKRVQFLSRQDNCHLTYSAVFDCGLRSPVSNNCRQLASRGTCVIIEDFMHSLPVRQRLIDCHVELEALIQSVASLCLINPGAKITLRDNSGQSSNRNSVIVRSSDGLNLDPCSKFVELFGLEWSNNLVKITSTNLGFMNDQVSIRGLIGSVGHSSRRLQFVFVNKRVVLDTCIHRVVIEKLKQSIMCRPTPVDASPKSKLKNLNNTHAVFCLFITCPNTEYDISLEPRKTLIHFRDWQRMREFIRSTLHSCLKKSNLLPPPKNLEDLEDCGQGNHQRPHEISGIRILKTPEENDKKGNSGTKKEESTQRERCSEAMTSNIVIKKKDELEERKASATTKSTIEKIFGTCRPSTLKGPMMVPEPKSVDGRVGMPATRDLGNKITSNDKEVRGFSDVKKGVNTCKLVRQWKRGHTSTSIRSEALGWAKASVDGKEVDVHLKSGMVIGKKRRNEHLESIRSNFSDRNVNIPMMKDVLTSVVPQPSMLGRVIKRCRINAMTKTDNMKPSNTEATMAQNEDSYSEPSKWLSEADRELYVDRSSKPHINGNPKNAVTLIGTWANPQFGHVKALACNEDKKVRSGTNAYACEMGQHRFLKSSTFDCLKLLNQVDKKFISVVIDSHTSNNAENESIEQPRMLVLFDQHAVHERIRLESLIQENRPAGGRILSASLKRPVRVGLNAEEVRLVMSIDDIDLFGLHVEKEDEMTVTVSCVPRCFVRRELVNELAKRGSTLVPLLASLLAELAEAKLHLNTTMNSRATLPKAIQRVLNSFACRTAIKFGEALTWDECDGLLLQLKSCKAPFQCAHGRPSLAPLVNLDKLNGLMPKTKNSIQLVNIDSAMARYND